MALALSSAAPPLVAASSKDRWRRWRAWASSSEPEGGVEIRVCVNRTCGRQGSRNILAVLSAIAPPGISVVSCGCLGRCGAGPNLAVLPPGAMLGHCGTAAKAAQLLADLCGPEFDPQRNLETLALRKKAEDELEKGNAAEAESLLSQVRNASYNRKRIPRIGASNWLFGRRPLILNLLVVCILYTEAGLCVFGIVAVVLNC
ncbi:hypothetical protein GW17_00049209 [Ensete ventricosum]|nr:hypothetical protein GW17_00049209 [Ensete ventricosum]